MPNLQISAKSAVMPHQRRHVAVEDPITLLRFSQQKQTASDLVDN